MGYSHHNIEIHNVRIGKDEIAGDKRYWSQMASNNTKKLKCNGFKVREYFMCYDFE